LCKQTAGAVKVLGVERFSGPVQTKAERQPCARPAYQDSRELAIARARHLLSARGNGGGKAAVSQEEAGRTALFIPIRVSPPGAAF